MRCWKCLKIFVRSKSVCAFTVGVTLTGLTRRTNAKSSSKLLCSLYGTAYTRVAPSFSTHGLYEDADAAPKRSCSSSEQTSKSERTDVWTELVVVVFASPSPSPSPSRRRVLEEPR